MALAVNDDLYNSQIQRSVTQFFGDRTLHEGYRKGFKNAPQDRRWTSCTRRISGGKELCSGIHLVMYLSKVVVVVVVVQTTKSNRLRSQLGLSEASLCGRARVLALSYPIIRK